MQITLVCAFEEWNIGKFKTLNNFDKFCCGDQKFEFVFAYIIVGGKSLHLSSLVYLQLLKVLVKFDSVLTSKLFYKESQVYKT